MKINLQNIFQESLDSFLRIAEELQISGLSGGEGERIEEIEIMLTGLSYAKDAVANPYDVNIENMGTDINSAFDDYGASISSDEKTIIFTSRLFSTI